MSLLERLLAPLRSLFGGGEDDEAGDGRTEEGALADPGASDAGSADGEPNDAGAGATSRTSTTAASGPAEPDADGFELRGRLDPDRVTRVRDGTADGGAVDEGAVDEGAVDEEASGATPAPVDPDAREASGRDSEGTDGTDRLDPEAVRRTRTRAREGEDEAVDRLRDLRGRATDGEPEQDGDDEPDEETGDG